MRLGIMQPYFFPYIGYFQLINAVDKFILYGKVNFIKKGYINRNSILNSDHRSSYPINVPVKNQSSNKLIDQIEIDQGLQWRNHLLKVITNTYRRAPYFDQAYPIIEKVLFYNARSIHQFNSNAVIELSKFMGINTTITYNEHYFLTLENSLNSIVNENLDVIKKTRRIFSFCEFERASHYINPIGGKELYERELFNAKGIKLNFLKTDVKSYKQFKPESFVPNLSIIDVLMFNSIKDIKALLNQFILI